MPAGIISTGNHPKLLWPGVHATYGQKYAEHAEEYTDLYTVLDSDKAWEEELQITPFGLAPIKTEGGPTTYDSEVQGPISRYIHIPYSLGFIVTYEEMINNLYKEVATRRAEGLAFSMRQTIETVAAFIYNNAFSTTYFTTGDGVALGSAAHTNTTGGTYSNILSPAADLSEVALENACIQIMGYQDDRGKNISVMPVSLHVARAQWFNAHRILKSVLQSDTTSNNINVLKATNAFPGGIKLNHYFTSPNPWFIRTNVPRGMQFFWRVRPNFDKDNDFSTKNALASAYMYFSPGCTDPRGFFGSNAP